MQEGKPRSYQPIIAYIRRSLQVLLAPTCIKKASNLHANPSICTSKGMHEIAPPRGNNGRGSIPRSKPCPGGA